MSLLVSSAPESPEKTAEIDERANEKKARKRRFFWVRVSILLFVLFVVVLYAVHDVWSRQARKHWDHTLDVVVVLVHVEASELVDAEAISLVKERASVLEDRLFAIAREAAWEGHDKPFRIKVLGPIEVASPPPSPESDNPIDLAKQAINMKKWLDDVDPRVGVIPAHWDSRIYVAIKHPLSAKRSFVEGQSEQDGRIGSVNVELAPDMADLTLFVVAHELMHTLGATDKYDEQGLSRYPDGFVEPDRIPRYPQRYAEVMARNRPISPTNEVVPDSLAELGVGRATAKEIGWIR